MERKFSLEYWEDDGWFVGRLKEAPGVFSQGGTLDELKQNVEDAYHLMCEDNACSAFAVISSPKPGKTANPHKKFGGLLKMWRKIAAQFPVGAWPTSIILVVALLFTCSSCSEHDHSPSLGPFGKAVHRAPKPITAEEIKQAKPGEAVNGLRIKLEISSGQGIVLCGNWIPENQGALGLPPEDCYLEATRDGVSVTCGQRPPGPEFSGGMATAIHGKGKGLGYPICLEEWGDFSVPGTYRVRLVYKSRVSGHKTGWSGIVASNEIEFKVVPEKSE